MATRLTRTVGFQARHHLWRADWTAERNRATFGALSESHPHDYRCAVTVEGSIDPRSGMLVDLAALDTLLAGEITGPLEGRDLNREVQAFQDGTPIPTCEALAAYLFRRLADRLPGDSRLIAVRVAEDETLSAECTGLE